MERYHKIDKIGEGTYGVVYKAIDLATKQPVALKKIPIDVDEDGVPTTAIREVSLLKGLQHDNVIRLRDVIHEPRRLYLVFDFVDTDLKQCMESQVAPLRPETVQSFLYQLLVGVAHCHAHRVLHRDLKPQNLLIDRATGSLKLADFGLSRTFRVPGRSYTNEVVTLWYRAPEVLLGAHHYSPAVDVWSIGCIFGEMLTGRPLFPGDSEIDEAFRIFRILGTPCSEKAPTLCALPGFQEQFPKWRPKPLDELVPRAPVSAVDLLKRMFEYEPARRITARQALSHPYFEGVSQPERAACLAAPSRAAFMSPQAAVLWLAADRTGRLPSRGARASLPLARYHTDDGGSSACRPTTATRATNSVGSTMDGISPAADPDSANKDVLGACTVPSLRRTASETLAGGRSSSFSLLEAAGADDVGMGACLS